MYTQSIDYLKKTWSHTGFQKYFKNTSWMFLARIISFITSFFTVAIVARYLGPENLGKLEYTQSFVTIIFIGTAIYTKLVLGVIALLLSIGVSILIGNNTPLTTLIGICALTFIISPIGTIGILFNAQVKAKHSSYIAIFLAFFIPALKLLIIHFNKGILYFALIILIESFISTVWSLYIYKTFFHGHPQKWKFEATILKQLLHDSWPLFLAGFTGYIYAKMDQVLILHYIDSTMVGVYGVAVKLTQIWAFLPGLIITSLFPAVVNARKVHFEQYAKRLRALSLLTVGTTVLIALPLFIFAPWVISLIFGNAYIAAVPILRIYLWTSVAITLVVLAQHYLIAENLSKIFLYSSVIGATTNVVLNIILIPAYGASGSAWGTMLSYLAVVASLLLFKKSRNGIVNVFTLKYNG